MLKYFSVTIIGLAILIFFPHKVFTRNNTVKIDKLTICNKLTGRKFKIGQKEDKLADFDKLIQTEIQDLTIEPNEYYKKYHFENISVYVSLNGHISSFKIISDNIQIKLNGNYNFSVGDNFTDLEKIFTIAKETGIL